VVQAVRYLIATNKAAYCDHIACSVILCDRKEKKQLFCFSSFSKENLKSFLKFKNILQKSPHEVIPLGQTKVILTDC
jgi:hypothetical protein